MAAMGQVPMGVETRRRGGKIFGEWERNQTGRSALEKGLEQV